jgi:hypothetical protein
LAEGKARYDESMKIAEARNEETKRKLTVAAAECLNEVLSLNTRPSDWDVFTFEYPGPATRGPSAYRFVAEIYIEGVHIVADWTRALPASWSPSDTQVYQLKVVHPGATYQGEFLYTGTTPSRHVSKPYLVLKSVEDFGMAMLAVEKEAAEKARREQAQARNSKRKWW